jgi:hypothetical protein
LNSDRRNDWPHNHNQRIATLKNMSPTFQLSSPSHDWQ